MFSHLGGRPSGAAADDPAQQPEVDLYRVRGALRHVNHQLNLATDAHGLFGPKQHAAAADIHRPPLQQGRGAHIGEPEIDRPLDLEAYGALIHTTR
jgi:hypothetical protein